MMDKCEGCPLNVDDDYGDLNCYGVGPEHCHLTEAGMRIIEAMIMGKWSCGNCMSHGDCDVESYYDWMAPCSMWQPRKDKKDLTNPGT